MQNPQLQGADYILMWNAKGCDMTKGESTDYQTFKIFHAKGLLEIWEGTVRHRLEEKK